MNKLRSAAAALLFTMSVVSSSYAIVGAGFHWGFDLSLSMDDVKGEKIGDVDANLLSVSRTNWKASPINFGGKAFIDIIPFIDAVEVSCNFGLWQYDGMLVSDIAGEEIKLGLDDVDLGYFGLSGTPYAKLQLDATIRKKVFALPLNVFRLSAGAGLSMHFATPLLTGDLVKDVFGSTAIDGDLVDALAAPGSKESKKIVQKIVDETLSSSVFGMHIVVGASAKLPLIPVGIYVDGKYMIPFGKLDKDDKYIDGFGLLINAGIMLSI